MCLMRTIKCTFYVLKPFVIDGPGWTYIKLYAACKDGREPYKALTQQASDSTAIKQQKSRVYNEIHIVSFRGTTSNFSLDLYRSTHASSHVKLFECKEPVSETKKAANFLSGISCPKLELAKAHNFGMGSLNEEFGPYQNYIKTYHLNLKEADKGMRSISRVDMDSHSTQHNSNK